MHAPADKSTSREIDTSHATDGDELNLKQAATVLGVHYMTAYRYVRQGRLSAHRAGTSWRVTTAAIERFQRHGSDASSTTDAQTSPGNVDWGSRLIDVLLVGDEATAWRLIENALAAGHDAAFCYLDMIAAAISAIDERRINGSINAAEQPLATAVAYRLTARLGARFRRPGRSRGTVVFGAPLGERHSLPIAIVADLVRLEGFDVLELGADVPPDAFAAASRQAARLVAVGIGITSVDNLDAAQAAVRTIRTVDLSTPIIVGGQAVLNNEVARLVDVDVWAPDGRGAAAAITDIARRRAGTAASGQVGRSS